MVRMTAVLWAALWRGTLSLLYYPVSLVYSEHTPPQHPAPPACYLIRDEDEELIIIILIFWIFTTTLIMHISSPSPAQPSPAQPSTECLHWVTLLFPLCRAVYVIDALLMIENNMISIMLLQATIIRHYIVKTQTSVASFSPPDLSIIFSSGMYLEVSPL